MPAFDRLTLRTQRLLLRPLRESDAETLLALFSDPKVMRYWSCAPWTSRNQATDMLARDQAAHAAGEYVQLGLELLLDAAQLIGTCTLFHFVTQCKRAELGYALSSAFWRRGYMHEALCALLDFAFVELDLNRVEADIDPRNEASAKSLERLGFRKEGHLRQRWIVNGQVSDTALYGLLRSDWNARK